MVLARDGGLQVGLHARLRLAPAEQAERVAGELGLGEKRRQAADDEDDHGPGREAGEQHAEADDRDRVLQQAGGAHHQRQRPARRLTARARQLVVELRVLELRELEGQRLLQDHHVHAMRELCLEQRLAQRDAAMRGGDRTSVIASASTQPSTGLISTTAPETCVWPAATTLSTMRAPIQATADGRMPANTVTRPNSTERPRLVAHTSSSARLVYRKTPKNRRAEFGASAGVSGRLAACRRGRHGVRSVP